MKDKSDKKDKNKNKNKYKNQKDFNKNKNSNSKSNQVKSENIMDFFVFNEDEDNIIVNSKSNEKTNRKDNNINSNNNTNINNKEEQPTKENKMKVDYNVSSFITSYFRPDLYSPFGIISGNKYKLKFIPGKSSQKLEEKEEEENIEEKDISKKEENKEKDVSSSSSDEKEDNEEIRKVKLNRYYNLEPDISLRCHICDQVGHRKDVCPFYDSKFCYRCLSEEHEDRDCELVKCFRCNKLGHKTYNCQLKDNKLIICDACHCVGHIKRECLIQPMEISTKFLKYNNLTCFYCGSSNHVLCPLSEKEFPVLVKEVGNDIFDEKDFGMISSSNENENNNNNNDEDDDRSSLTPKSGEVEEKIIEIGESVESEENKKNESKNGKENGNENENGTKNKKEKEKDKQIIEGLDNDAIKYTIFCGFCGGRHRNEECEDKSDDKFNNKFDEQRKNTGKRITDKRNKEKEKEPNNNNNRTNFFMKRKRDNDFDENYNKNKNYQKNRDKKNKNKFKDKFKEKYKSNSNDKRNQKNKSLSLNEDDSSENENYYNKSTKRKSFSEQKRIKDKKYKNITIKKFIK